MATAVTPALDRRLMARCLQLAALAEGRTAPNPMVGCVVTDRRGRILAEGIHRGPGQAHAEIDALAKLGGRARGTTLYVNLEPCNHVGRTPPCAPALVVAGVRRVVIGMRDPIAGHGGGAEVLREAGVEVVDGVLTAACEEANRGFLSWATRKRPWFTLKAAMTLDGRIAMRSGASRWITGEQSRAQVMKLRDSHDAVLVGVGTVLTDDPQLTVREVRGGRNPVRVVVDSKLRTPPTARLLARDGARVIIAGVRGAPARRRVGLERAGAEVWELPGRNGRVDLRKLAAKLATAGLTSLLVEGGAEVHASLLAAGLADEVLLFIAPKILGGRRGAGGPAWVGGVEVASLARAHRLHFVAAPVQLGPDVLLVARPAGALRPRAGGR
jgi:diaminohydroxyphosphoribosylaminopyrimidine deaminase/5-amino-6-(5-phosphoribosylamino)uracil reductase